MTRRRGPLIVGEAVRATVLLSCGDGRGERGGGEDERRRAAAVYHTAVLVRNGRALRRVPSIDCRQTFAKDCLQSRVGLVTRSQKRIDDLATLRAFAHPLRMRLLGTLRVDGPSTASELGRRFGETSGSTSYHLRQLARYGFIEEDPDQPSRRERRWRATTDYTSWDSADFLDDDASRAALHVFEREHIDLAVRHLQRWYAEREHWPRPWVSAEVDNDTLLRLRAEDLAAFKQELWQLIARYEAAERPADDADAERVLVLAYAFPITELIDGITARAARRRLMLLSALRWLPPGVAMPVLVLLVTSRGYSVATVGALFALHGAVVVALELPYRRDRRRPRPAANAACLRGRQRRRRTGVRSRGRPVDVHRRGGAARYGQGTWLGPLEAWYVDMVRASDPSADLKPGLARGHVAEALALALGSIVGGLLPGLFSRLDSGGGLLTPLAIPFVVAAVLGLINLAAVAGLIVEPPRRRPPATLRSSVRDVPSTIRAGLRLARVDRTVLRLLLVAAAGGIVITGLEVLIPVQFADLLGGSEQATAAYGIVVAVAFFASAGGSGIAPRAVGVAGTSARAGLMFTAGAAAAVLGLGLAASFVVAAAAVRTDLPAARCIGTAGGGAPARTRRVVPTVDNGVAAVPPRTVRRHRRQPLATGAGRRRRAFRGLVGGGLLLGFAAVLFIGIPDRPVSQVGSLRVQHAGASGREEAIEVKPLAVTAADLEGEPRQPRPRR